MIYVWIILGGVFGILLILLLIALIRTFFIKDAPVEKPVVSIPADRQEHYAESLGKMIRIKTISTRDLIHPEPFRELQDVMGGLFPNLHKTVEKTVFSAGSLLYRWPGKNASLAPLLFMAHQDVVPAPAEGWKHDPFSGDIADGEVHGRGTLDTKCTLFAFFQAAEELIGEGFIPESDIYFASSCDEEVIGNGAKETVAYLQKKGIRPYLVLDEGGAIVEGVLPSVERPMALLGVLEKGYIDLKIKAKSHGGHSSTPPRNTPLARLAKFIVDIETHNPMKTRMISEVRDMFVTASRSMGFAYRLLFGNMWLFKGLLTALLPKINSYGRALLSTTVAFTRMSGSDANNVIPSEASLVVNLRPHPIQGKEATIEVIRKLAAKYDLEIEVIEARDTTSIVSTNGEAYQWLVRKIRHYYPDVLVSPYVILGGTDGRHYSAISDAPIRFSPIRLSNDELKKMHGLNESVKIESLAEAVGFFRFLMQEPR
jgi:carboxypeptidase PM20D1